MAEYFKNWTHTSVHRAAAIACIMFLIGASSVDAFRMKARHKSMARLKAGLVSVRESKEAAVTRLASLKKREGVLNDKVSKSITPRTIPGLQDSLESLKDALKVLKDKKPKSLHQKLSELYETGYAEPLALVVGSEVGSSRKLSSKRVKAKLTDFDSTDEVLESLYKVIEANRDPSPKSTVLANEELKKIQYERKALLKKVRKCDQDEKMILAEMNEVKRSASDDPDDTLKSEVAFLRPVPGKVTSPFGSRIHPIDHIEKEHKGIDFVAKVGDSVKCCADGKVVFAGEQRGYGKIVIIQHSDSLATAYAHLSQIDVEVGEEIGKGDKLGEVGMTGNSTGPHLHFEVRENDVQVDPSKYL